MAQRRTLPSRVGGSGRSLGAVPESWWGTGPGAVGAWPLTRTAPAAHSPPPNPAAAAATEPRAAGPRWTSSSTTSSIRSIGSSSGPAPGWPGWPPRLRPLPLRRCGGLNPDPSLEGGFEELGELRPI